MANNLILKEISHNFDEQYYLSKKNKIVKVSDKLFSNIFISGLDNVEGVDGSLIFVSNHKSLGDIILAGYVFSDDSLSIPRFIGGNNLYVRGFTRSPILSGLVDLKKFGMISIDRSRFARRDFAYTKNFLNYMRDFFIREENLLFYPEGGRSYSGFIKDFETGMFNLVVKNANVKTRIVPVFNNYDFVIDAVGFEKNKSTKFSSKNKFKRFVSDFSLFYNHSKNKRFFLNDAFFEFGEPVLVKDRSLSDLMKYCKDSFVDVYKVSCVEVSSFALKSSLKDNSSDVKLVDVLDTLDVFVKNTLDYNMMPKLLTYKSDVERVFLEGISNINMQKSDSVKMSGASSSVVSVFDDFLVNFYANSVFDFYKKQ